MEVVDDAREGRGPLQGLAAGLAAVRDRAHAAYASSTDVPLLHPRFIRRVLAALDDDVDVVLPEVGGFRHPLAAAYRTELVDVVERLIAEDRMRPAFLFEACRVRRLDAEALLADPALAALDPDLDSLLNLNEPADYEAARARPAPEVTVRVLGRCAAASAVGGDPAALAAATVGEAAAASGLSLDGHVVAALNGDRIARDPRRRSWRATACRSGRGRRRLRIRSGRRSDHGRRRALGAGRELGTPAADQAGVAEGRAGELERGGVRVVGGDDVVPVEDVLAERVVPARGAGESVASANPSGAGWA